MTIFRLSSIVSLSASLFQHLQRANLMLYPNNNQSAARPLLPAMPVGSLVQNFPATRASKNLQIASFALATGLTFYAVLIYDFGTTREHCFMPVRRWFDEQSRGFFTLSEGDRKYIQTSAQPSTKTPVEFFRGSEINESKRS